MKPVFVLLFFVALLKGNGSGAQTPSSYQLPGAYQFDYSVEQSMSYKNKTADTTIMYFYYTKNGDYAAARITARFQKKGNLFIVMTRDGMTIVFDEQKKEITILSLRKLASDLMGLTKWIRMDSLMAHMHNKPDGRGFQSVKTGNTKPLGKYSSDEYTITGNRGHKGSVWCTKVDFATQTDYILSAVGGNMLKMMTNQQSPHPLLQALMQSNTLVTEINLKDSSGDTEMEMHTVSINPITTTVSTAGYTTNDYSNMTLPEIFQAEMKKRNH